MTGADSIHVCSHVRYLHAVADSACMAEAQVRDFAGQLKNCWLVPRRVRNMSRLIERNDAEKLRSKREFQDKLRLKVRKIARRLV